MPIHDVAAWTEVSVATVSRVLNGKTAMRDLRAGSGKVALPYGSRPWRCLNAKANPVAEHQDLV